LPPVPLVLFIPGKLIHVENLKPNIVALSLETIALSFVNFYFFNMIHNLLDLSIKPAPNCYFFQINGIRRDFVD
jgi:hypothetical protein